ncbi:MAG: class I adenylate-forming enzyme family protein [Candidatus Competibacteraceae bacterium]
MLSPPRLLQDTLRHSAGRLSEKTAIVSGQDRLSYARLWQHSVQLANRLQQLGIRRGDRVAIFLDNTWRCAVAFYGTLLADAVLVTIGPQAKADKLAYILNDSGATVLIAEGHLRRVFLPAVRRTNALDTVIVTGTVPAEADFRMLGFDQALAGMPVEMAPAANITLDLCALIYTSGTTGEPKGVMHTHQSLLFAVQSLVEYQRLEEADRILCVLPLSFNYGLGQLLMATYLGATLVLETSVTYQAQLFQRLQTEAITVFPGVPTLFAMLLATHASRPLCFPQVKRITSAGAALPAGFHSRLQEIFPQAEIYRMYGLTECKRVSYLPPEQIEQKPESVGIPIPGTEVRVLDDNGRPVKPGEIGKLYVRGPHVMLGYWNQPEKTATMLDPGPLPGERLLCTHDLFTVDEDGYLYFIGRSDDIIKTCGEKVSPVHVETVLYDIPGIREAAVLGMPDALLGQAVLAFVSLLDGSVLSESRLKKWCSEKLEAFMMPRQVICLPELPKNANGKIDKKALAADYFPLLSDKRLHDEDCRHPSRTQFFIPSLAFTG